MRFINDAQLPFKLASFLRKIGHDAVHTSDLPNKNFSEDNEIIRYSIDHDAVVISKDVDFLNAFVLKGYPKKIILVRTGNIKNNTLLDLFESNIHLIIAAIDRSSVIELYPQEIIELY